MQRYLLEISYNGLGYFGWQIQPNQKTIQGELNQKLSILLKENINIVGAGRTDTGVHAIKSFAHFDSKLHLEKKWKIMFSNFSMIFFAHFFHMVIFV